MFVQIILGVIMVNRDKAVFPAFHGFGGLFIMGLGIRAMLVGQAA